MIPNNARRLDRPGRGPGSYDGASAPCGALLAFGTSPFARSGSATTFDSKSRRWQNKYMLMEAQKLVIFPRVTMRCFRRTGNADGRDEFCAVISEQDYFVLEKIAQRRGKTVFDDAYWQTMDQLRSYGYTVPPERFHMSVGVPDYSDRSGVDKPTYN
jgi:hypothetical protein